MGEARFSIAVDPGGNRRIVFIENVADFGYGTRSLWYFIPSKPS